MSDQAASVPFVLITGASSGIGREMAVALSTEYPLILGGRDADRLELTRQACHAPERHLCWARDLADIGTLGGALSGFLQEHGASVSGFVHCAAMLKVLPLRSIGITHAQDVMNTNVLAALEIARVLTRKNVNRKALNGIVFISSIASQFGAKGFTAYCASKAGLDGLMKALAVELAPEVRVNSVLPGSVRTPMTQAMYDDAELAERLTRDYPLGVGFPSDINAAVAWLLSDQARWITGHQLVVDGGRSANISA
ncbi:SDR family oxidoreductase [Sphingomonas parva]|uniref:SDR family oxidoreductase n=1 Tax=Sphingomonas parva TaxID=2555898 RepID=A0A4Y8ZWP2_9SPHN|nr:SDR family oxidoreductase [Sphingomonas parva]TFI59887.1 SDR family oxidoreductase [Sphingomonas parva]